MYEGEQIIEVVLDDVSDDGQIDVLVTVNQDVPEAGHSLTHVRQILRQPTGTHEKPEQLPVCNDRNRALFVLDMTAALSAGGLKVQTSSRPNLVDAQGGSSFPVDVTGVCGGTHAAGSGLLFYDDGGASFSAPITLDDTMPLGRVDVLLAPSGDAIVCWLDTATDAGTIQLCRATPDGDRGPRVTVATTGQSRASGFPRMAFLDSAVLVVWTEEGDVSRLRGASVPLTE